MSVEWNKTLKRKIVISYFLIFLTVAAAIIFLFKGIQNIASIDKINLSPNAKLHEINKLLTLIYKAENEARSFFLSGNNSEFEKHSQTLSDIEASIDTLGFLCLADRNQQKQLITLKELLAQKRNVIKRLSTLNIKEQKDLIYTRAMDEIYNHAYDLRTGPQVIKKEVIVKHDSVFTFTDKRNIFQKMKGLFSSNEVPEQITTKISKEETKQFDSIISQGSSSDTILKTLEMALGNLKTREQYLQNQSMSRERKLLQSDRQLLEKIREIVTSLEAEEIEMYSNVLAQSSSVLRKTSMGAVILSVVAVIVMIFFLLLIFRDISTSRQHQKVLQEARLNAENLIKVKEQFIANVSHEIRTPLGSVIGYTEQLQKTSLNPAQKQYVDTIDRASEHLLGLVNDILDLSKIEAGKLSLENIPFNLKNLIEEVCQSLQVKIDQKGLCLHKNIPSIADLEVLGDPFRIRQILLNILGNAIKFTEKGSITVTADLLLLQKKYKAEITITDTGIGIPEEKQKEIFDEFSQADSGTTRKYGGTGLGLSIAQKLAEMHGGNISLHSCPGAGSSFTIKVLLEKPCFEQSAPIHNFEKNSSAAIRSIQNCKVLVVEDDETTSVLLKMLFNTNGIDGVVATNGLEALEILERGTFDVVFTDIQMPGMSGTELLNHIRKSNDASTSSIPVIAFTANALARAQFHDKGFSGFLFKPFRESDFLQCLACTLNNNIVKEFQQNVNETVPSAQPYSFVEILEFADNDPEALKRIVKAFILHSTNTLEELKTLSLQRNTLEISMRAHRLLPTFRQFHLHEVVTGLEMLERYNEMGITDDEFYTVVESIIPKSLAILQKIAADPQLS